MVNSTIILNDMAKILRNVLHMQGTFALLFVFIAVHELSDLEIFGWEIPHWAIMIGVFILFGIHWYAIRRDHKMILNHLKALGDAPGSREG